MVATPANSLNLTSAIGAVVWDGVATISTVNDTSGYVLTSNGVGFTPQFKAVSSPGLDYTLSFLLGGM